jgi:hypothetical protein
MSVIELDQARRDQHLKSRYLETVRALGINDPLVLSRIEAHLTPEAIAQCRHDMEAIVRGEPGPPP